MNDTEPSDAQGRGARKLTWLAANSGKMLILALIYGAMNLLSFVSLQRIDAAAFTVCAQLKILTTAFFSVVVLGRKLTWTKWRALLLIVAASILVSTPSLGVGSCDETAGGGGEASDSNFFDTLVGFGAVLLEVVLSGFASIYFEKVPLPAYQCLGCSVPRFAPRG